MPPLLWDLFHFLAQFKKLLTLLLIVALFFSAALGEYVNAGIILIINISTGRPALDSLLFALALSLGLTPEILPAILLSIKKMNPI